MSMTNVSVSDEAAKVGVPDRAFEERATVMLLVPVSYTHLTLPTNREV